MLINIKPGETLEIRAAEQVSIPRTKLTGQMLWESWSHNSATSNLPGWDKVDSIVQKRYDEWANYLNRQLFGLTFSDVLADSMKGF